jgi:OmpA-OmpF porin, OOP family
MRLFAYLFSIVVASTLTAYSQVLAAADLKGSKDHPLISRFVGSQIDGFQELAFDEGAFYLPDPSAPSKELNIDTPVLVEGKITRLLYLAPVGKTPLEVHRNYEQALKAAGVTIKTAVNGTGARWEPARHWRKLFGKLRFQGPWAEDVSPFWRDGLYLYGVVSRAGSMAHVSVLTAQNFGNQSVPQAAVAVQIVEEEAMKTGQVLVNVDALKKGLSSEGKMALYGIYFDTGKATVKPESDPQLQQMATLLKQNPSFKVFVVGHTDNQGGLEANLALSLRRAEAVVAALTSRFGVNGASIQARGVANLAPVASNAEETGRSKNRRVELVLQ